MTKEKWINIISDIKDKFEILEEGKDKIEEEGGVLIEYICFLSPMGKIRLELIDKPLVLDKKVMYSNRIGSDSNIEYVYSETERNTVFNAYKWSDSENNWISLDKKLFE